MSQTEVQLIKDAVIVNADVSNSAAIDVSKISGAMPLAGGTFTGDILFQSDSGNILFDKSDNALEFSDNNKAKFGGSGDLEIYHDGSNSYIDDAGTGNLVIRSNQVNFDKYTGESLARFRADGNCELFHNNVSKFETAGHGINITGGFIATGNSLVNDNGKIQLGSGSDLQLFHDGSNSFITNISSGGFLHIRSGSGINLQDDTGDENFLKCIDNGAVQLYHDNNKMVETTSGGFKVFNKLELPDGGATGTSARITIGTSDDLKIYHDGTNSVIKNDTNTLVLRSDLFKVTNNADNETLILGNANGEVELYYDNARKLKTNSTGVQVGTTSARFLLDSLTSGDGSQDIARVGLNRDNGSTSDRQLWSQVTVAPTVAKFNIFARTANDSGTAGNYLEIDAPNNNFNLPRDNEKLQLGTSQDLQLYHDGSASVIKNATGDLYVQSIADVKLRTNDSELAVDCTVNDSVALYYDASKKFETTSVGTKTFGRLQNESADGNTSFRRDVYYLAIPTQTTKTITLTSLNGTGVFRAGGYTNAGQGALALHILFGGAMFATQHYQVNELINSGMQNTSISTSKNSTNFTIAITNSSTSYSLVLQIYLESTGSTMGYAVA
tara:strand:+ start:207 stop:2042 length:1836 start_codon:yes stop_codon:yes gene_type:complete